MEEFKTSLAVMQVHDILTMADNLDFSGFKSSTITVMLFFSSGNPATLVPGNREKEKWESSQVVNI